MHYVGEAARPLAVSVDAFKLASHVLPGDVSDDAVFAGLLRAAQSLVERVTGRPIGPGLFEFEFIAPRGLLQWWFPCAPVVMLDSVALIDADGAEVAQPLAGLSLIMPGTEPQVVFNDGWAGRAMLPAQAIRLRAVVGLAASDERAEVAKQAIILQAREWYVAGLSLGEAVDVPEITFGIRRLLRLQQYRRPYEMTVA